ncbi:thiamine phosphate synthase [Myroides injenensis]|uniref:thiamine phosphate synthase n=1 Tax=Myroides injenensis TaxID=1183151 RepID=UPI00028A1D91|nr:thiamine phosphate synthase [Myroides injenensis]
MKQFDLSLYLVTDSILTKGKSLEYIVEQAVLGGVTMVQLREKEANTKDFYNTAIRLKKCLSYYNIPLIINDRIDIALACDAAGVHIGQNDMPCDIARKLLGPYKIIGLSVDCIEDVKAANAMDIDYIGISPIFNTPTKSNTASPFGIEGVKQAMKLTNHPAITIGGIQNQNAKEVIQTGVNGIAVVSAIISSEEPQLAAKELSNIIKTNRKTL